MAFDVGKAQENLGTLGEGLGSPGPSAVSPFGLKFDRLVGLGGFGFTKMRFDSVGAIVGGRSRQVVSAAKPLAFESPLARAFLGMPSKDSLGIDAGWRVARQASKGVRSPEILALPGSDSTARASGRLGAVGALGDSPLKKVADGLRLSGAPAGHARGWQALGTFGDHDCVADWRGICATMWNFATCGPYGLATAGTGAFAKPTLTPSLFDQIGKIRGGYAGFAHRVGEVMACLYRPFGGFFEWLRREIERWPRDPDGGFVPIWNVRLYQLAEEAYFGKDYVAQSRFLDEIGADESVDNVLLIRDLLEPTFDPKRPDRRTGWWNLDPWEARRWLCRRLRDRDFETGEDERVRQRREISYTEVEDPEDPDDRYWYIARHAPRAISAEMEFLRKERAALLYQELALVLPERQLQVLALLSLGWSYERIARELGIAVGTVKTHVFRARNNPDVSKILLPRAAFRRANTESPHKRRCT